MKTNTTKKSTNIITANNIFFRYQKDQPLLEGVSFCINTGDFIGIIGANGGGKSTLLKLILGFLKTQKGQIKTNGLATSSIGYIPQFSSITQNFPISIKDVVASGLSNKRNFLKKDNDKQINTIIKQLHLENISNKLISEVSGGERQRALIARALVKNPDIIIADEPTSNIDIHREKEIFNIFEQLHLQGKTLIVVSHDIFLLKKYATIVFDVNKHLHTHQPEEITEKLIYESYICPDCKGEH